MRNILRRTVLAAAASLVVSAPAAFAQDSSGVPDTGGPKLVLQIGGQTEGKVVIDLLTDKAPKAAERLMKLAKEGKYDDVVFHRVIDGFMAQTGDVQFGKKGGDTSMAGMGGSDLPDLPAEFSNISFQRGIVGMARSADPNSANSQFFIMFAPAPHLDGQYTVVGHVVSGMDVVDKIKKGDAARNGVVEDPDYIVKATVEDK
ncbi:MULTISPECIES: peptidylprolyl isomerase [Thioclava]|uniref:Peptidyl-prolyl cis-trans isomerase n=1 Tax=Thioclava nitratireducens TaxID=1915078 RepID=A0ABM6IID8_9RHOB|nr:MULTISPECIES: peptidylprolyl isomerase [Thioclava]AQS48436.1 peptidylprolyl isomerase [Thioclava nitratireducens]OWY04817.1 peptidylprolyl isomerase [Thioclava sp. F1Mire-8]OWY08043.1 peptidylprolyl isomerase [Thioclava sp. F42-5]OWY15196.1 peptidylprolyl isomerase [Thioclava sp. F34-6]OWY18651.1 peptidylprolyl isomerase [Thioclava sp. JM3]